MSGILSFRVHGGAAIQPIYTASFGFVVNAIKRYIPRVWRYFLDFLTVKGESDELWLKPELAFTQVRKTAIEITAAHSDTVFVVVESDEWSNYNVEKPGADSHAIHRFPDPELVFSEWRFAQNFSEVHAAVIQRDRRKHVLVGTPAALEHGA